MVDLPPRCANCAHLHHPGVSCELSCPKCWAARIPDLDLCPTIWCPVDDCDGYCSFDGSWWCEKCGTTWDRNGANGQRSA